MYGQKRPVWQWVIICLCLGVVVYAGIYYFFFAKKSYSQPTQVQSKATLTSDGFSPSNLTIRAGSSVTWTNKSGKIATVDSGPHPLHTVYSPLNLGSFADGSTLTLTFDKPGTYGYHNHLNPSEGGTIIVE